MPDNKAKILLLKFEENAHLEKFFLDQGDRESLVNILADQESLLPGLIRQMELLPSGDPLRARLQLAAEMRVVQEKRVAALLGEISRELGRLRQSAKRLQDWRKAWRHGEEHDEQLPGTYA